MTADVVPNSVSPASHKHKDNFHPAYRPDIDGLRAVAILSVLVFHAFPYKLHGGFVGVDIFFVISGFLISSIIIRSLHRGDFDFLDFYVRRIKRIFPALIVVLVACHVAGWFILLPDDFKQFGKHVMGGVGFVENLVLWNEAGYFDADSELKPLLHLWSLAIEEQFYLLYPLLIWGGWRLGLNLLSLLATLALISFALNIFGMGDNAVMAFFAPQTRFWELLAGSLLACLHAYRGAHLAERLKCFILPPAWFRNTLPLERQTRLRNDLLSIAGFILLLGAIVGIDKSMAFPGWLALFPVTGAFLLILAGSGA